MHMTKVCPSQNITSNNEGNLLYTCHLAPALPQSRGPVMAFAGLLYSVTVEMTAGDPVLCKKVPSRDDFVILLSSICPVIITIGLRQMLCLRDGYLAKLSMTLDLASS